MTIPKTSAVPKKKNKPWWNDECQVSLNARTRALDLFKRFPTKENQDNYRRAYARARRVMQESMRSSWRQYVSKLNNNTPMNKVWDMFRKITGKKVNCNSVKHLKVNDEDITDRNDIANILAETVSRNSSSVNYDDKFQQNKAKAEKKKLNFTSQNMESYNSLFTIQELQESLARAHDTAVGPDDIHYQLLKHLPSNSLLLLLHIFNDIWTTGNFPSCWRQATIIPIPKPGKDSTNPTNYRPIALTSCLCKTMERMVNNRLVYYLEYNGILTAYQSGFRKHRSTIDQIIRLETAVREAFIKREHAVAIFFDLEKAYDTTWKYGIMRDLHDAGLRGRLPIFISNFLSNREFMVRLGTIGSNLYSQEEGVPQGSILSVTLFSLKINSIVHCLSDGVDCSLYVDDFLICYRGKQMHTIERKLQLCLKKIQEWAEENGFRFSKSKTVCMHFCTLRKEHADPTLILNGTEIPLVEEFKFLGVIFDKKLSFKSHINYIKVKCSRALNLLKVVSNMNWGADRDVLLRLYRSLIRSKLDYGCIVYGSARPSYIKALDTIHNQGIRICLGAFRTSPMESLYVEADEPSLYRRREKLALQYAIKLKSLPQNPTYEVTFNPQYVDLFENKPKAIPPFGIRIQRLSAQLDADINCIAETKLSDVPPWEFQKPKMNYDMHSGKKRDTDPFDYQVSFHDIQAKYHDHDFIYTDGSKDGNKVGYGVVYKHHIIKRRLPNICSIYTAELKAILHALKGIERLSKYRFIICVDSLSALQAIEHKNIQNPIVLDIMTQLHNLTLKGMIVVFCWVPSHVDIPGNEKADKAAKAALELEVSQSEIPHSDFKPLIYKAIQLQWQLDWNELVDNKLNKIKPDLGGLLRYDQTPRRDQIVFTRARLGHTYLTHGFLLRGEDVPECVSCRANLSVEHILLHCNEYNSIRAKYFKTNLLRDILSFKNVDKVVAFLREAGLYYSF